MIIIIIINANASKFLKISCVQSRRFISHYYNCITHYTPLRAHFPFLLSFTQNNQIPKTIYVLNIFLFFFFCLMIKSESILSVWNLILKLECFVTTLVEKGLEKRMRHLFKKKKEKKGDCFVLGHLYLLWNKILFYSHRFPLRIFENVYVSVVQRFLRKTKAASKFEDKSGFWRKSGATPQNEVQNYKTHWFVRKTMPIEVFYFTSDMTHMSHIR